MRSLMIALIGILVLATASPVAGMETRTGPLTRVAAGQTVDDDLYVASGRVVIDGRVRGDLVVVGGQVRLRGQVDGDVWVLAGAVEISGPIGASVRVLGGSVLIEGTVGGDVVAAGGTVEIEQQARIRRDLAVAATTLIHRGATGRDLRAGAARVEIAGTVGGNVVARAGELLVTPQAAIGGNLTYSSERPALIVQEARVTGSVVKEPYPTRPMPSRAAVQGARVAFGVFDFLWMLVLALVLVGVAPGGVQATSDALRRRPWASLGWGFLMLVAVPAAVLVLVIMLIGIPVAAVLVLIHILALFASHAAVALAIGQRIAPRLDSRYAAAAVGVGVIAVATNLPVVGVLLRLLAVALGVGAVGLALWGKRAPATPVSLLPGAPAA